MLRLALLQGRDVARVASVLSDPMNTPGILSCWMANLKQVDPSLPTLVSNPPPSHPLPGQPAAVET